MKSISLTYKIIFFQSSCIVTRASDHSKWAECTARAKIQIAGVSGRKKYDFPRPFKKSSWLLYSASQREGVRGQKKAARWRRRNLILLLKNSPERANINKIQSVRRAHAHPHTRRTLAATECCLSDLPCCLFLESNRTRRPSNQQLHRQIDLQRLCPSA